MKHCACAVAVVLVGFLQAAFAQSYPAKPIELVVHTGPGGGSDLVARVVADVVAREKLLPQPLIVQNRAGRRRRYRAKLCGRQAR